MLSIRRIRDEVVARLACLKTVDEDAIHTCYQSAISAEVERAMLLCSSLASSAAGIVASTKDQKWVMVERAQLEDVVSTLEKIANEVKTSSMPVRFAKVGR